MGIRLIGRKWKATDETIDGFKVISVELELAMWEDKDEKLFKYMSSILLGDFPLPGTRLYEADLDNLIMMLTFKSIYGEDKERTNQDRHTFTIIREWLKKNYPYGYIEFDVC
jgi:hypothetical protein